MKLAFISLVILIFVIDYRGINNLKLPFLTGNRASSLSNIGNDDLKDLEKLVNKFKAIDGVNQKVRNSNVFSSMRFKQQDQSNTETQDLATNDGIDLDMKFSTNPVFDTDNFGTKDKELKRRQGLSNGQILYNGKKTVNVETSEFADFYYDTIKID